MSDNLSEHDPRELALLAAFETLVKVVSKGLGVQLLCALLGLVANALNVLILLGVPMFFTNMVVTFVLTLKLLWFRLKCPKGSGISGWKVSVVPILFVLSSIGLLCLSIYVWILYERERS